MIKIKHEITFVAYKFWIYLVSFLSQCILIWQLFILIYLDELTWMPNASFYCQFHGQVIWKTKQNKPKKTSWKIQTSIGFDYYQRYFSLSFHSNSVNNWKNECVSRNLFSRNSIKLVNKIHFCTFLLLLLLL